MDEVLHIHERVCGDFASSADPVDTPGPRDSGLLDSAIARQLTGTADYLKYSTVWSNAATLTFGLCCNHPFHNGNKRTALVCMIAHLEKNGHTARRGGPWSCSLSGEPTGRPRHRWFTFRADCVSRMLRSVTGSGSPPGDNTITASGRISTRTGVPVCS